MFFYARMMFYLLVGIISTILVAEEVDFPLDPQMMTILFICAAWVEVFLSAKRAFPKTEKSKS